MKFPKYQAIIVDGLRYRCDAGSTYGDGGKEYNVRLLGERSAFQANGRPTHVTGQVTRFYVQKNGVIRESDPKKSKMWKTDTPRSQWLDWRPFALAFHEKIKQNERNALKKRETSSRITVRRDGKLYQIPRNEARPSELEAWLRGDKI